MPGGQQINVGQGTLTYNEGDVLVGSEATSASGQTAAATFIGLRSRKVGGGAANRLLGGVGQALSTGTLTPTPLQPLLSNLVSSIQGFLAKTRDKPLTGTAIASATGTLSPVLGVAPTVTTAVINNSGDQLTVTFSEPVTIGASQGTPVANMSGGTVTTTYLSGADTNQRVYTLSRVVAQGETGTLSYTQAGDGYRSIASGLLVASFSGLAITNNSTAGIPVLLQATIPSGGTTIVLLFSEVVNIGAGGNGGFTLSMSGGASSMTFSSGAGTNSLIYNLGRAIGGAETGTLAYIQPGNGIESVSGGDLVSFSGSPVTNSGAANPNDRYIRLGATGANNGLDWTNAWTSFSSATNSAVVGGATVWVAGGNYGGVGLNWQGSPGAQKTLRKATIANHGTSVGWNNSFDTQVIFDQGGNPLSGGALGLTGCNHVVIDGQVRSGLRTGYGIRCMNAYNGVEGSGPAGMHNITLRYMDISSLPQLPPATEDSIQYKGDNLLVEYCWLHGNSSNRFQNDGHGDGIQAFGGNNLTVRYCVFENQGQHIFYGSPGFVGRFGGTIKIYYNLFYNRRAFVTAGGNPYQGIVWFIDPANTAADTSHIYNNTFDMQRANGFGFEQAVKLDQGSSGGANFTILCRNNAVRDSSGEGIGLSDTHTHNAFVDSGVGACYFIPTTEANVILGTDASMGWVDAAGATAPDYHLQLGSPLIGSGTNVSSIAVNSNGELRDIEGKLVTNAATPDRGCFQF